MCESSDLQITHKGGQSDITVIRVYISITCRKNGQHKHHTKQPISLGHILYHNKLANDVQMNSDDTATQLIEAEVAVEEQGRGTTHVHVRNTYLQEVSFRSSLRLSDPLK